ncbi:MAG TPA: hypothetical protein VI542_39185 [Candidatus Tectomicrobia bacterium]
MAKVERNGDGAKIVPLAGFSTALPTSLATLEQAGLVTQGSGHIPDEVWTLPRPQDTQGLGRHALEEERETGR